MRNDRREFAWEQGRENFFIQWNMTKVKYEAFKEYGTIKRVVNDLFLKSPESCFKTHQLRRLVRKL